MARSRRIETANGMARLEPVSVSDGNTFNIYRGHWFEDWVGTVSVERRGTSDEVWTWWNGAGEGPDTIGMAASEAEAVAALLRVRAP